MECYREIRPAVDFCRALDHVLRIKTLWLKSYLLQILETLENKENRHKLVSFENAMLQHCTVMYAYQIEFSIFL